MLSVAWLLCSVRRAATRWLAAPLLAAVLGGHGALAMTIEVHGTRVFATGMVGEDGDLQRFTEALATPGLSDVVLVNSPGGQLRTALAMARLIEQRGLRTLAAGRCMSACSVLFMAGAQRQFATGVAPVMTMVGIHGAHRRSTKEVDPALQPRLMAYYKQRLGAKFDEALVYQALYSLADSDGFLRVRDMQRNAERERTAYFCPAGSTPRKDCQTHDGKDALSLGVVTSAETVALVLPDTFKPRFVFFGRTLAQEVEDPMGVIRGAAQSMCRRSASCPAQVAQAATDWLGRLESKAFALGTGRAGLAWHAGATTPLIAAGRAMYACNHDKNSPKLCRLAAADRYDLDQFYLESEQQTLEAWTRLAKTPTAAADTWADEVRDDGVSAPTGLRIERLQEPTPLRLAGVASIATGALVERMRSNTRPVLIDVDLPGANMLPGAVHFWNGGLGLADEALDAAYDERFRKMLAVAAPDKNKPVVFYCAGPNCWLAVNAALRAARAGYQDLSWYRGGLASWRAADLPLVQKVPSAVLN